MIVSCRHKHDTNKKTYIYIYIKHIYILKIFITLLDKKYEKEITVFYNFCEEIKKILEH